MTVYTTAESVLELVKEVRLLGERLTCAMARHDCVVALIAQGRSGEAIELVQRTTPTGEK